MKVNLRRARNKANIKKKKPQVNYVISVLQLSFAFLLFWVIVLEVYASLIMNKE